MDSASPYDALKHALAEGDLATAKQLVEALSQSPQLAAEVLHELRQPLLGIKAYAQLIAESDGSAAKKPVAVLLQQVERIEQIIADFTRLSANKPAHKERVNLAHHVRQAAAFFSSLPESARISLEIEAPTEVELHGNGRLLEQLTLNLLNNARDAMNGLGRIKVRLQRDGGAISLQVADWGPGIAPEHREKIFDPYVTHKAKGSGLGLAVCRRIAQEHGAQIGLPPPSAFGESPPPATVFRVLFPLGETAHAAGTKRLLVVDDEEIIRSVFRDLMGKEAEVVEAESAEEALAQLDRGSFDLIVTDKNLPGLSGLDLAQAARKRNPDSKVILMTGYPSVVTAQQAIELGVQDYLLKPFDEIREVRQKLRAALAAPAPSAKKKVAGSRRIDVYEDDPVSAKQISDALAMLGLEGHVLTEAAPFGDTGPSGVIVSWAFGPAPGKKAVALGKQTARGAPFVVLADHLTMETALESLRGGAVACLPKLLNDVKALSREIQRALKLPNGH